MRLGTLRRWLFIAGWGRIRSDGVCWEESRREFIDDSAPFTENLEEPRALHYLISLSQ